VHPRIALKALKRRNKMSTNKNKKSAIKVRFGLMTQERATEINNGGATLTQWRRVPKKNNKVVNDKK